MGKETGGKNMDEPHSLKSNEMAECCLQLQQPLVCDSFKNCEGFSRVAFTDGNGVVVLGSCNASMDPVRPVLSEISCMDSRLLH